jgi:predicted DNA-binding transcriptional regulator YafY
MSHQLTRMLRMIQALSIRPRTTRELLDIALEDDAKPVTIRQIQRDIQTMNRAGVPVTDIRDGREVVWTIPTQYRALSALSISRNEVLLLHVVKGLLSSLRNTRIERELERLRIKLEKLAPGTLFIDAELTADVSPGRSINVIDDRVLDRIIDAIVDPHWDRVTYRSLQTSQPKTFVVSFCRLVDHAGRLYVAAWHPRYQRYISLAADRIDHVERADDIVEPLHHFDASHYRSRRFGVYDGEAIEMRLRIDASAANFFESRQWHPSQVFKRQKDGSTELRMKAPLSPELVSWIVSWADVLTVRSPKALIDTCKAKVQRVHSW